MKLIGPKYMTLAGAQKRCAFENAMAPGEFKRGDKAKLYRYAIVKCGDHWRIEQKVSP